MVKQGKLSEYVDKPTAHRQRSRSPPPPESGHSPRRRSPKRHRSPSRERRKTPDRRGPRSRDDRTGKQKVIHMIAGGLAAGGDSITKREVYSARLSTESILGKRRYTKVDHSSVISFDDRDLARITTPQEDALVITAEIAKFKVERILVDGGSSSDLMYLQCYDAMGLDRKLLRSVNTPLVGFAGKTTYAAGVINLPLVLGKGWDLLVLNTDFIVVDAPNTYNVILGRTTINPNRIVASTAHQVMRFPSLSGEIGEVWGDQQASRRCYVNVLRLKNRKEFLAMESKRTQKTATHNRQNRQTMDTSGGDVDDITESLQSVHLAER